MTLSAVRKQKRQEKKEEAKEALITITLSTLLDSRQSLSRLMSQPLPGPQALGMARILRSVQEEEKSWEDARLKLCKQFGKMNLDTGMFEFEDDQRSKFNVAFAEMQESAKTTEVTLRHRQIPTEVIEKLTLMPIDIAQLYWLIPFETEETMEEEDDVENG